MRHIIGYVFIGLAGLLIGPPVSQLVGEPKFIPPHSALVDPTWYIPAFLVCVIVAVACFADDML